LSGHSWKIGGRKAFPAPFDNQINILLPKLCCLKLFYFAPTNKQWYLPVFFCLVGLSNAKSVQNTSIYATQEDTEISSVLSNM